jgi:hypothetical protein
MEGTFLQHIYSIIAVASGPLSGGRRGGAAETNPLKRNYPADVIKHTRKAIGLVATSSTMAI